MLQAAAPSCGEPRPISRVGRIHAGRPHRPCFRHTTHTYRRYGLRTLRDCAALCRTCAHCVYISFNLASNDCSWFRHCALVRVILTLALTPTLTLALALTLTLTLDPLQVDCESSRKYYHFIRLMGREASHLTLEAPPPTTYY